MLMVLSNLTCQFSKKSEKMAYTCDQKLASDSSGLSGGFRGIGRGFGL
jgi:hypothetical protein